MSIPLKLKPSPRILSVQSHVVSGYCGNKSATFPLQLLGFEVDVANTVQLSNHTQYSVTKGQIFGNKELEEIHEGLKANNLLRLYDGVLTGYIASVGYLESLSKMIEDIKITRREMGLPCLYTLDPVLGDDATGFYVPKGSEIAEAYKRHLLPLADIITPNKFEASVLSGTEIDSNSEQALQQANKAIEVFHDKGIGTVIITSLELKACPDQMICLLSSQSKKYIIRIPKLDCQFTGTGDLFSALFTGWMIKTNFDLQVSLQNTINAIHEILQDTFIWYEKGSVQSFELRLIQNKESIMNPQITLEAQEVLFDSSGYKLLADCTS